MKRATRVPALALCLALSCSSESPRPSTGSGGSSSSDAAVDAAGACGEDAGDDTFPCDVAVIIQAKCQRCHNVAASLTECLAAKACLQAPFPLLAWSDTRREVAPGLRVIDRLESVISSGFMPFQSKTIQPAVETLTDAEKAVLLAWVRDCGPPGTGACSP